VPVPPLAAALVALAAAAPALDAPLGVRTQGTFRELFLDVTGADARRPAAGELDVRWTVANDWSTPTLLARGNERVVVRTDEQADVLTVALRLPWERFAGAGHPLLARMSTAVEARLLAHWGGWTDGLVEAWHHLAHYENFDRELYPRNAVHVWLRDAEGRTVVALDGAAVAPGDVTLRQQVLLAEGGASQAGGPSRWGVSARLDLKLPVGVPGRLGGSGGVDAGAALLATAELTPWLTAHGLAAASVWSDLPGGFPLQPRPWHGTFEASLAAHAGAWALIVEDRLLTPAFGGGWAYAASNGTGEISSAAFATLRPHNQITVGLRRGAFTTWFCEDFTPGDPGVGGGARWFYDSNAPDIVFGLSWRGEL